MPEPDAILARTADIEVHAIVSPGEVALAVAMLDAQELRLGLPLVDESERARLTAARPDEDVDSPRTEGVDTRRTGVDPEGRWRPLVALRGDEVVGYAAIVLPDAPEGTAVGDLAPARVPGAWAGIVPGLLNGVEAVVGTDAADLQMWVRQVDIGDLAPAVSAGYRVDRRLGVLGRSLLGDRPAPEPPEGTTVRAYVPDDGEGVVAVLAAAYDGTGDGGWTLERFRARQELDWFRAEDLLVAVDSGGRIGGLHWLKRRDATTGEVYNLAVHPDRQGEGLGPVLLGAGLVHLVEVGCSEVMLWVDRANERAVSLYTSRGFVTKWDDVALRHALPHATGIAHTI